MTQKQVVLITGASSGIGYATTQAFVEAGYCVVGLARRKERLDELRQSIIDKFGDEDCFLPLSADVQNPETLQVAVEKTLEKWGRLDVIIANAGLGHRGAIVDADWHDIETLLRTNIDGVIHTIRAGVPAMQSAANGGHVIIISSVVYNMVSPHAAYYAASKAFVSSLSRSLRLELKSDNIHVTDMLIGRTVSEFNEKRLGQSGRGGNFPPVMPVEKVAEAIVNVVKRPRKSVAVRWIDRLIVLGNLIVPDYIGRRAGKQYK